MKSTTRRPVGFLIPTMRGGGTERAVLAIANYFADVEEDVVLYLFREEGVFLNELRPKIKIIGLGSSSILGAILKLAKLWKDEPPLVVISALNDANLTGIFARTLARKNIKIICSLHNHHGEKFRHYPSLLNPLRLAMIRFILERGDSVVCVSKTIADWASSSLAISKNKLKIIRNPAPKTEEGKSIEVVLPFEKSEEDFVYLGVGRLCRQKNFSFLIKSFALLPENAKLVILGEGPDRAKLEKLIAEYQLEERVFLPGFKENATEWMSVSDCFVLSSSWEGFPFVLLEALSAGVPIVATDCLSGPLELLEGGKYGKLVPPDDVNRLSEAMLDIQNEDWNSEHLKKRAEEFGIERIGLKYLDLVHGLVGSDIDRTVGQSDGG